MFSSTFEVLDSKNDFSLVKKKLMLKNVSKTLSQRYNIFFKFSFFKFYTKKKFES